MLESCAAKLASIGRRDPRMLFVPGRIEFLGKHTDYAGGRSLICATEKGFCVAFASRDDDEIRITDVDGGQESHFEISANLVPTIGHWSNYPITVARRVARNFGPYLRGADIVFSSDLPPAAGLSSSSALMIAIFLALSDVNQLDRHDAYVADIASIEDLAGYLGTIENGQSFGALAGDKGVGTFGGSQDHTAILCSKPGMLRQYSFAPPQFERDIALPKDHVIAIASSGVLAEKTAAAREKYNRVAARAREVLQLWNKSTGRSDPTLAATFKSSSATQNRMRQILGVGGRSLLDRFEQFHAESEQIIPAVGDALLADRVELIGPLIDRSQQLAETMLGNQVEQTIFLQRSARALGAVAASAFGAGFGGSVWALIPEKREDEFTREWSARYADRFPQDVRRSRFLITRGGPPALRLAPSPLARGLA